MCVVCSRLRDNNEGSEFGRDGQQEHRERRMGVLGKKKPNKLAHIRNKWKMRACGGCLSMDRLDNSLSVSLPSWGWVTGRVLHYIALHNSDWGHLHRRREKREDHCSPLPDQRRASPFFFLCRVMEGVKEVSGLLKAGTHRWAHRNPS